MEQGLEGSIPTAGFRLPDTLRVFNLYSNKIRGSIGQWQLPPGLIALSLWNNQLSGSIPSSWELPGTLKSLYLNSNRCGLLPNVAKTLIVRASVCTASNEQADPPKILAREGGRLYWQGQPASYFCLRRYCVHLSSKLWATACWTGHF